MSLDASVEDVLQTLREHELPGVPVVDGEGRVVGIVTEADLVLPDDEGDLHIPHYVNLFGGTVFLEPLGRFEKRLRKAFASTAADMMTADPDAVGPDTTVRDAARLIHDSGHNRLAVVDAGGRLVGVITRVDLLGALGPVSGAERALARGSTSAPSSATARPAARRPGGSAALCAVVKADGYGHGAAPAAPGGARRRRDVAGGGHRGRGRRAARARHRAPACS